MFSIEVDWGSAEAYVVTRKYSPKVDMGTAVLKLSQEQKIEQ